MAERPGGGQQTVGALVVGGDHVHGDVPGQHAVVGAPEACSAALVEEVLQAVAVGEHVAGPDRRGHVPGSPLFRSLVHGSRHRRAGVAARVA